MRDRHASRLTHRQSTARHRDRLQEGSASITARISDQELTAPGRAVVTPAKPIEHDPDGRVGVTMLDKTRNQMGMMMLHRQRRSEPLRHCELRRQVLGMQVMNDELDVGLRKADLVRDRALERRKRPRVLEIAEVH